MEKTLRQAMPDLKTASSIWDRADDILILRMTMPRDRSTLRIYLKAPFLIAKRDIFALEAAVKNQYFHGKPVTVRVYESFVLTDMTPEEAYEAYRESILLELKTFHLMDYNLFRSSLLSFSGDGCIYMEMPDTLVYREKAREVAALIESIFVERLGFPVSVRPLPRKMSVADELRARENEALKEEISRIAARYQEAEEEERLRRQAERDARSKKDEHSRRPRRKSFDEGVGIGTEFDDEVTALSEIVEEIGDVAVQGEILTLEQRQIKSGNYLYIFAITDKTDSIKVKMFAKPEERESLEGFLKEGAFVRVKGLAVMDKFDREITIQHVTGLMKTSGNAHVRSDNAPLKRVELHAHTQMSEMDAVTHTDELVKRAAAWGHRAVAITDHGVVQSFPDAMHTMEALEKKGKSIKILYGCEGYLVDDTTGKSFEELKSTRACHVILLAKNDTGRVNLYRLVSESHLNYYFKRPRIPKSLLMECREGIIIGSACEAGELYQALVRGEDAAEIARLVNFYDYLEVQPIGNNGFMLREGKGRKACTEEDLRDYVRKIVSLGEQFGKPVVATSDVHFLDPEDEVYRRIIQKGQGYEDADEQPPLFLRTTEEMLAEFEFLGHAKAEEIVVTNTNRIADLCEAISPVRPDKCPPVIEGSEEELQAMCYKKAHEWYGDPLPPIVEERLAKELKSIIGNGYAVMYIIAQRLVKHSNDDGYMVGSRGSVGSSFVATMSGITEVNPLIPHYRCPRCRHSIWEGPEVEANLGGAGVDMPDKDCPLCGTKMIKDGFDIPFETFLGFKGDKEPDIDLNFSGEYQSKAHEYTEVLFGKGHTFKAGTITGIAEKTAYGYALKYYEEKGQSKRRCEIERLAAGCVGTRRTTGQHPGGIVVMPHGENIYSFTPIQHPANDVNSKIITTHFDYHSIDHNLLKLDILGHDDPTMIRRLEDLIGIDATTIPLDDPAVISLFKSPEALGITSGDLGGCPLGTLGIPEFGTDFAMQIVLDAKPENFADLVRIAGISHGTNVWLGNVQDLILSGTCTLPEAICTRDDIMLYLISKDMDKSRSFKIMEAVRKGKVAKGKVAEWPEWKADMEAHGVPDWYIGCCQKIEYMFPKAHAAAYVMMAWRVAWCKVHHPLEYYTAYYSIRADGFNYELMCLGQESFRRHIESFRKNADNLSDIEKLTYRDMRLVEEMFARGYDFMPIDIYRAKATRFQIIDGKIMPSFVSIAGMGEKAAIGLEEAARDGKFLSREELVQRSHVSSTIADLLYDMGILGEMPKTNQLSFTDLELL